MNVMNTATENDQITRLEEEEKTPAKAAAAEVVCPKCGSASLRESNTRRRADILPSVWGKTALRCRDCQQRFSAKVPKNFFPAAKARDRHHEPLWRRPEGKRKLAQAGIIVLSLIAFAAFLYLLAGVGSS